MQHSQLRQQLIDITHATIKSGLNQGVSGNLSVRVNDGMLITPSGLSHELMTSADIVFMHLDSEGEYEGHFRPSSEWRFHRDIYRDRKEAGAVLHAHSNACTTLACLNREIPAFHYMIAMAGGNNIRCAPYAVFGSQELSEYALAALEHRKACLLANHGLLCLDADIEKVFALAVEVENLAQVYMQALQTGEPVILDDAAMQIVIEKFADYQKR
ncbi:MAG: class II aldolase/adducin family protein [Gammaproteobacteria bacterium]